MSTDSKATQLKFVFFKLTNS